jgi:hypothetical protein
VQKLIKKLYKKLRLLFQSTSAALADVYRFLWKKLQDSYVMLYLIVSGANAGLYEFRPA